MEIGSTVPFYLVVLMWLAKVVFLALVCSFLGLLGIRVLDVLTPHIHERARAGEDPISVGLFIAGFFIFIGLVIHGAVTAPMALGGGGSSFVEYLFDLRRLGLIAMSFFISLLLGIALFNLLNVLTPKIPFLSIRDSSAGMGIYIFGYLVFFGLIIHGALTTPL